MKWHVQSNIDSVTREVIREYEGRLARAGLRATYDGVTVREDVPGMRESEVQLWFYRGRELVDQLEVPVERPGLEPASPEDVRQRLREALWELTALHAAAAEKQWVRPAQPTQPAVAVTPATPATPRGPAAAGADAGAGALEPARLGRSVYARRLQALTMQVLIVPAAALAGVALVGQAVTGAPGDAVFLSLSALIGTYVFAFPTAALASLLHTRVVRALGRETERLSTLLGGAIGLVAGACTPWFVPLVEPWPVEPLAAFAVLGGVTGAAYGALVARRHPMRWGADTDAPRLPAGAQESASEGAGRG
jgi:hypothetical protein